MKSPYFKNQHCNISVVCVSVLYLFSLASLPLFILLSLFRRRVDAKGTRSLAMGMALQRNLCRKKDIKSVSCVPIRGLPAPYLVCRVQAKEA